MTPPQGCAKRATCVLSRKVAGCLAILVNEIKVSRNRAGKGGFAWTHEELTMVEASTKNRQGGTREGVDRETIQTERSFAPYVAPRLRYLGSVRELTLGSGELTSDVGGETGPLP
jgi:hypothetical protein